MAVGEETFETKEGTQCSVLIKKILSDFNSPWDYTKQVSGLPDGYVVYDVLGNMIISGDLLDLRSAFRHLPRGLYFIQFINENEIQCAIKIAKS